MIPLASAVPAWWDPEWAHRSRLTFDNTASDTDLVDFPVMVHLVDDVTFDHALAQPGGVDLRFVDGEGKELPYEIERWGDGGESIVWVEVPRIHAGSDSDAIWMYYGNASAAPEEGSPWASSYLAVFHLDHDGTDSTRAGRDATDVGTTASVGAIGRGRALSGDAYLQLAPDPAFDLTELTVSLWVRIPKWDSKFEALVTHGDGGWRLHRCGTNHTAEISVNNGGDGSICGHSKIDDDDWHQVVATIEAHGPRAIYIDGERETSGRLEAGIAGSTFPVGIGTNLEAKGRELRGDVDEVRIDGVARSADEVHADWLSQSDQFVTFCGKWGGDEDWDGVCDEDDVCPGSDDFADFDGDGVPDGCDPCPQAANAVDDDGDGACSDVDCDDSDPSVYPGAPDPPGDGVDRDCDGRDAPAAPRSSDRTDGAVGCRCETGTGGFRSRPAGTGGGLGALLLAGILQRRRRLDRA